MARRDGGEEEEAGSGEQLEPDPEEQARRDLFERSARQGADQLAAVVDQALATLADDFAGSTQKAIDGAVTDILERVDGTSAGGRPQGFVSGALFGALVFAFGVLLGRYR